MEYTPNIKSKGEFLSRFDKLLFYFSEKENKNSAERGLYSRLLEVRTCIELHLSTPYQKDSANNMLPFFEYNGGLEMMESEIGNEATDLLYYFVQNY